MMHMNLKETAFFIFSNLHRPRMSNATSPLNTKSIVLDTAAAKIDNTHYPLKYMYLK